MKSKQMRLIQSGYEKYTGPIGAYEFVDGLSVELIPENARDRLATAFQFVEIDEDGEEQLAGSPAKILRDKMATIEPSQPLPRQTEEEKRIEDVSRLLGDMRVFPLRSKKNLEMIADEMGIAGVRLAADPWNVRSKSIPDLINLILEVQASYAAVKIDELVSKGANEIAARELFQERDDLPKPMTAAEEKAAEQAATVNLSMKAPTKAPVAEPTPEPVAPAPVEDVVAQAVSGDLAAALTATDATADATTDADATAAAQE